MLTMCQELRYSVIFHFEFYLLVQVCDIYIIVHSFRNMVCVCACACMCVCVCLWILLGRALFCWALLGTESMAPGMFFVKLNSWDTGSQVLWGWRNNPDEPLGFLFICRYLALSCEHCLRWKVKCNVMLDWQNQSKLEPKWNLQSQEWGPGTCFLYF